jgi:ABC-type transporter lipoprotein component MlaA
MKKTLQQAIAEHTAIQRQIAALEQQAVHLDKVIVLLGKAEDAAPAKQAKAAKKKRGRKATPEQRQKMRDAWVRRKQKQRAAKKAAEQPLVSPEETPVPEPATV